MSHPGDMKKNPPRIGQWDEQIRCQYEPMLPGCHHLPAPYTYRTEFGTDDPASPI
jgi:hypothetical protein